MNSRPRHGTSIYPLVGLAGAFIAGILFQNQLEIVVWPLVAATVVSTACALTLPVGRWASLAILFSFAAAGALTLRTAVRNVNAPDRLRSIYDSGEIASEDPVEVEGLVFGDPEPAFDGYFIYVDADRITHRSVDRDVSGRARLFVLVADDESRIDLQRLALEHGTRVHVDCFLERDEKFNDPGVRSFRQLLDQQGVDATASLKSPLLIERLPGTTHFSFISPIFQVRVAMIDNIRRMFSMESAGVLTASMLGDRHFLDKGTADVFRQGGTFHILVISGLHITFIGGVIFLFVRRFTRRRIWQFVVPTSLLWTFTIAVGADVPVVRASLMFTTLALSRVIFRRGTLLNSLALSALLLLIWRPQDLFAPSFLLTFVSVAAIVAIAFPLIEKLRAIGRWIPAAKEPFPPNVPNWLRRLCEMLYWNERLWSVEMTRQPWSATIFKRPFLRRLWQLDLRSPLSYVFEGILVSLIVQIALMPLSIWYFHRLSPVSVFLNLWVGAILAAESFLAVAAVILDAVWSPLSFPFIQITELFSRVLVSVPASLAGNDWASFRVPSYSGDGAILYFLYFVPVVVTAVLLHRWDPFEIGKRPKRWMLTAGVIASMAALVGLLIFHPFSAPRPDGRLTIDFLDVGQGDSALVTFPDGETMLIDGGGRPSYDDEGAFEPDALRIGEQVVSEFLWEKGYSKIDYIVATHADADHVQGLADVANNFSCRQIFIARKPVADADLDELLETARKRNVRVSLTGKGETFEMGGARIDVLYPQIDASQLSPSNNNSSIVLRLTYGERSFLLTGDIEQLAEQEILNSGTPLKADVVKVPHHGSRTSSTRAFIDAVHANYAVISAPRRSPFGHPHPDVVERWLNSGADVLTTGNCGAITFSTEGIDLKASSYLPGCFAK